MTLTMEQKEKYARLILIVLVGGLLSAKARDEEPTFESMRIVYNKLAATIDFPIPPTAANNFAQQIGSTLAVMRTILNGIAKDVPLIEVLAVRKTSKLPGPGFDTPCPKYDFNTTSPKEKKKIADAEFKKVLQYDKWADVLERIDWRASFLALNK